MDFQKRVREAVKVIALPAPPKAVDISPEWDRIATGHVRGGLYVWSTTTGESAFDFTGVDGHEQEVTVVQFSPDGTQLAFGDQQGKIIGWSVP